jgi:hypothetical protein
MLLSYVLRIVKAMDFIHYEKWYTVLNNLINLHESVLLKKIIAFTMLHILMIIIYYVICFKLFI